MNNFCRYGLLGPSGCGKTVLLNCIIGSRPLDCGFVKLGVTKRSELGYMPQVITVNRFLEIYIEDVFHQVFRQTFGGSHSFRTSDIRKHICGPVSPCVPEPCNAHNYPLCGQKGSNLKGRGCGWDHSWYHIEILKITL